MIRNVDALRDDQWERLKDLAPCGRAGERGPLDKFLAALTTEADLEWLMIDSTIVRAHQHAAGARIAKGGRMPRVWGDPAAA